MEEVAIANITFIPSNISYTCPVVDCRQQFLGALDFPLLMAGLFGKAPKHLPSSWIDGEYKTEYSYSIENDNISSVGIAMSKNGAPYNNATGTYVWESLTSE